MLTCRTIISCIVAPRLIVESEEAAPARHARAARRVYYCAEFRDPRDYFADSRVGVTICLELPRRHPTEAKGVQI